MVIRMFESQIGRNMKAYIDDMVLKGKQVGKHLADLGETFSVLRKHKLRLNASMCFFRVSSGKVLGYMITHRGIAVNLKQIKAINSLHPPRNPKEVQRLTRMAAALNRFISRSADMCRPFFQLLHKWKDFRWTEECVTTFEDLKQYLSSPPILSKPNKEELLYAYLAVMDYAVSFILVRNEDGIQRPVYYINKSLQEAETRYLSLEKAVLAIAYATRKLPHYFQAYTVVVLTQLLLQALLRKSDYTGRIAKWGTMLEAYDVKYMPRIAIKWHILANFVVEFIEGTIEKEEKALEVMVASNIVVLPWELYTDGTSN